MKLFYINQTSGVFSEEKTAECPTPIAGVYYDNNTCTLFGCFFIITTHQAMLDTLKTISGKIALKKAAVN